MSTQVNPRQFTLAVGTGEVQVLPLNASRKLLMVGNNGTEGSIVRVKVGSHFLVATNASQLVSFSGAPTSGEFTLTFVEQTTDALAYNVSAATLKTKLEALTSIGAGNVDVSGTVAAGFTITFKGTLAAAPQPLITAESTLVSNAGNESAVQNIPFVDAAGTITAPTAGTFVLVDSQGNETAALAFDISTADLKTALNALPAINGDVDTITQNGSGTFTITFGAVADSAVPVLTIGESTLTSDAAEQSQVEVLYATPAPTQGTYKLMVGDQTTTALAYNASAATIQTALRALSTVGAGNVTVTGTSLKTGFTITYGSGKANTPMPVLTPYDNLLHADSNTVEPQMRVPDVVLQAQVAVPGVGLTDLTPAPYVVVVGQGDVNISVSAATTVTGVTALTDGMEVAAGEKLVMDKAVPLGAVYVVASAGDTPVEVWEG